MSTFGSICDALRLELNGYTQTVDNSTPLASPIVAGDLTISVADGTSFSAGVVQIDDELIYCSAVDRTSGVLTVPTYGRGYGGSTAASHAAGAEVIMTPSIPRVAVKRAVNETIQSVYTTLFAVGTGTATYISAKYGYPVDASADAILSVAWYDPWAEEYVPIRRWRYDSNLDIISIHDNLAPGRTITWTYRKPPTVLTNSSDDFATVSGLPQSSEDVIRFGAAWRLLPYVEAQNSITLAAEADFSARRYTQSVSAVQLAQVLYRQFQERLSAEGMKLLQRNPIRAHYSL